MMASLEDKHQPEIGMEKQPTELELPKHGGSVLPSVTVDSYNLELKDEDGFVGDKASQRAFSELLDKWRKVLSQLGEEAFGSKPSSEISKKDIAALLAKGDGLESAVVFSAIEEFAQQLTSVIRQFLRLKAWKDTECLVIGGGFSDSRIGELAIGRSQLLLKSDDIDVALQAIRHDPNEAGLLGAAHLVPGWMLKGHDGLIAIDIGGTNFRVGIIDLDHDAKPARAKIVQSDIWRHGDDKPTRDEAIERLCKMIKAEIAWAKVNKISLVPMIGIGCPGLIDESGSIVKGGQNLPGNWESRKFSLPSSIKEKIPQIEGSETMVVMHNDAVVQGLSQVAHVKNRTHWGVLTIGTGLGNARFTNRAPAKKLVKKV